LLIPSSDQRAKLRTNSANADGSCNDAKDMAHDGTHKYHHLSLESKKAASEETGYWIGYRAEGYRMQVARLPTSCSPMPDRHPWDTGIK